MGKALFGLQNPEKYKRVGYDSSRSTGDAVCFEMSAYPSMMKVADSECETEVFGGNRLGSINRLAVYKIAHSVHAGRSRRIDALRPDMCSGNYIQLTSPDPGGGRKILVNGMVPAQIMCVCACVCLCVRACKRVRVRVCVCAYVCQAHMRGGVQRGERTWSAKRASSSKHIRQELRRATQMLLSSSSGVVKVLLQMVGLPNLPPVSGARLSVTVFPMVAMK